MYAKCSYLFFIFSTIDEAGYDEDGEDFLSRYYNGGSSWNTNVETLLYPSDGETPEYILRQQAARVKSMYEAAQDEPLVWPGDHLPQFDLDEVCETRAAQCCWPQDRQANDNNGNCAKEYDTNCIDKDPGDNTDLCAVDLEYAPENNFVKSNGFAVFRNPSDLDEGPIHCHGFAWANDESDTITRYKANNLFYVSMYDHMHQRGYVRNIGGAPMCGCVEKMPIASRSDCTQVNVQESYKFTKASEDGFVGEITRADVEFQACQGANNDNNDLEAYYQRLVNEGKLTTDQQALFKKYIVGNNNCGSAIESLIEKKGYERATKPIMEMTGWTYVVGEGKLKDPSQETVNVNGLEFKALLDASPNKIVKRVCPNCSAQTHRVIYYKRLTPVPDTIDLLDMFMNNWYTTNNKLNEDYELYSNYEDALLRNTDARWNHCTTHHNPGVGFPYHCGPNKQIGNQWNSYYRGGATANDHAFYVEAATAALSTDTYKNIAVGKTVGQSSTYRDYTKADKAVDGNTADYGNSMAHTNWQRGVYWYAWLGTEATINEVIIFNRSQCCRDRLGYVYVEVLSGINSGTVIASQRIPAQSSSSLPFVKLNFNGVKGETVRLRHDYNTGYKLINIAEVVIKGDIDEENVLVNLASMSNSVATQSSLYHSSTPASDAIDGSTDPSWSSGSMACTKYEQNPWWMVDFKSDTTMYKLNVINRYDCCWTRLNGAIIEIINHADEIIWSKQVEGEFPRSGGVSFDLPEGGLIGQKVRVRLETGSGKQYLTIAEVQVFGKYYAFPSSSPSISMVPTGAPSGAPTAAPSAAPTTVGGAALKYLEKYSTLENQDEKDGVVDMAIKILQRHAEKSAAYVMSWFGY